VILPDTDFTIEQRWSGIMGMGNSKEVILKQVSPSVYCAVRFGGMGVALGSYIGREAAIMIANG
jgi:glycine/D-amino acid oxidase-like deaminating enzyme